MTLSPFEELRVELNRVLSLKLKSGPSLRWAKEAVEELKMLPTLIDENYLVDDEPRR